MKLLSLSGAFVFAVVLGGACAFGFEGRVPIYKSVENAAPAQGEIDGVTPSESRERIAVVDPELLWENWSDAASIPTAESGSLAAPTLIDRNSPRKRGAVQIEYDAIVVWNGLEDDNGRELLIFGSQEKSIDFMNSGESDVALGIVPVVNKPSSLQRAGAEFEALKNAQKLKYSYKSSQDEVFNPGDAPPERAPYCAFTLEIQDAKSFTGAVNHALALRLPGAETSFSPEELAIVEGYLNRGVRHFVFDVFDFTELDEANFAKTALAFEFPSSRLFVPAAIGKLGKSDRVSFNLLVVTPENVTLRHAPESWFKSSEGRSFSIAYFPNSEDGPVPYSIEELKELAPTVAKFCEENKLNRLVTRQIVGAINAQKTDGDLEMTVFSDHSTTSEAPENAASASEDNPDATSEAPEGAASSPEDNSTATSEAPEGAASSPEDNSTATSEAPEGAASAPEDNSAATSKAPEKAARATKVNPAATTTKTRGK